MTDKPKFYQCGICDHWHRADWNGDCREDDERFFVDQLDGIFGPFNWDEIEMPGTDGPAP